MYNSIVRGLFWFAALFAIERMLTRCIRSATESETRSIYLFITEIPMKGTGIWLWSSLTELAVSPSPALCGARADLLVVELQ